jgi:hypothetical protein
MFKGILQTRIGTFLMLLYTLVLLSLFVLAGIFYWLVSEPPSAGETPKNVNASNPQAANNNPGNVSDANKTATAETNTAADNEIKKKNFEKVIAAANSSYAAQCGTGPKCNTAKIITKILTEENFNRLSETESDSLTAACSQAVAPNSFPTNCEVNAIELILEKIPKTDQTSAEKKPDPAASTSPIPETKAKSMNANVLLADNIPLYLLLCAAVVLPFALLILMSRMALDDDDDREKLSKLYSNVGSLSKINFPLSRQIEEILEKVKKLPEAETAGTRERGDLRESVEPGRTGEPPGKELPDMNPGDQTLPDGLSKDGGSSSYEEIGNRITPVKAQSRFGFPAKIEDILNKDVEKFPEVQYPLVNDALKQPSNNEKPTFFRIGEMLAGERKSYVIPSYTYISREIEFSIYSVFYDTENQVFSGEIEIVEPAEVAWDENIKGWRLKQRGRIRFV